MTADGASGSATIGLAGVRDLIAPGVPIEFSVYDAQGRLLLARGQVIGSTAQLEALLERGASVRHDEAQALRQKRQAAAGGGGPVPSQRRLTLFDHIEQQVWALDRLLRRIGKETGLAGPLLAFADDHVALVDAHPDAALFHCIRQDDRRFALYPLSHSLHTATVALLASRRLSVDADGQRRLVAAALTMNVSALELQATMAEQKEPPTKKQLDAVRSHPERSAKMLQDAGVADDEWLAIVAEHHERSGGGGYPQGLAEPREAARLLRACDVLTSKVSPRAMRAPLAPQVAARQLFQEEKGGPLAAALIQTLGVYPPGDFVLLKNGEVAIVSHRGASATTPKVVALIDASAKPLHKPAARDTSEAACAIVSSAADRPGLPRVLPEAVYGLVYR